MSRLAHRPAVWVRLVSAPPRVSGCLSEAENTGMVPSWGREWDTRTGPLRGARASAQHGGSPERRPGLEELGDAATSPLLARGPSALHLSLPAGAGGCRLPPSSHLVGSVRQDEQEGCEEGVHFGQRRFATKLHQGEVCELKMSLPYQ